jgi:hypothetical protein
LWPHYGCLVGIPHQGSIFILVHIMKKTLSSYPKTFLLAPGMLSFNASRNLAIISGIALLIIAGLITYVSQWGEVPTYQMFFHFGIGAYLFIYGFFLLDPKNSSVPRLQVTDTFLFIKPSVFKKGNTYYWDDIKALEMEESRLVIYYKNDKQTANRFDTRPKEDLKLIRIAIRDMAEQHKVRINRKS